MKVVALLCLASIAFGFMESLQRTDFGKALSETIDIQLKLQGGVDKVIDLIDALDASIGKEQTDHDAEYELTKTESEAALANYQNLIDVATEDKNAAAVDLETYTPLLEQTVADLADAETDLENKQREKREAEAQREAEKQEYDLRVVEHEAAIKACDEAAALVAQMYAGETAGTFLQKKPILIQAASHVAAVRKVAPNYAPILSRLIQMSAGPQANQSKVGQVLELVDRLKADLQTSLQLEHDNEAAAIAAYNDLIDTLTQVIADLEADVARLTADKETYEIAVADAEARLADAQQRIDDNTKLYEEKSAMWQAYQDHYAAETERRNDERAVCQEASQLLRDSFADTSDYVMSKVEDVEF